MLGCSLAGLETKIVTALFRFHASDGHSSIDRSGGQKVLDFMPRLMTACGRDVVAYEIQGKGMSAQSMAAPFAQYIQQLQRSYLDLVN